MAWAPQAMGGYGYPQSVGGQQRPPMPSGFGAQGSPGFGMPPAFGTPTPSAAMSQQGQQQMNPQQMQIHQQQMQQQQVQQQQAQQMQQQQMHHQQQQHMQQQMQQQQQMNQQMPTAPSGACGGDGPGLTVSGCQANPTVDAIIRGSYVAVGQNHGKPVYKRTDQSNNNVSVLIYYWDERDGPSFSGWWFGPKVGGDQVWAYNGDKASQTPPLAGWHVPWDGPEDTSLRISKANDVGGRMQPQTQQQLPHQAQPAQYGRQGDFGGRQRQDAAFIGQQQAQQAQQAQQQAQQARAAEAERQRREHERQERERREREEDERRRRQQEEERRRRVAEEERRAAEIRRCREEEAVRRRENAAALAVRKVIQKVRVATPESFESLKAELHEAQAQNSDAMGSQASRISDEAADALKHAMQRVQDIVAQRQEEERRRQEIEKRKKEEAEKVERLKCEMSEQAKEVEAKMVDMRALRSELKIDSDPESVADAASTIEQAVSSASEAVGKIESSMRAKWVDMGDNDAVWQVKREVQDMLRKVSDGRRELDVIINEAKSAKTKAERKRLALLKEKERREAFERHDMDKDGKLDRSEVHAFSKSQFDFTLSESLLDKIMRSLEPIDFAKYRSLFQKVAIARSEVRARAERVEAERKRKLVEEHNVAIGKIAEEASEMLQEAETAVSRAESEARPLAIVGPEELTADGLNELADTVEKIIEGTHAVLDQILDKCKKIEAECDMSGELKGQELNFTGRLSSRHSRLQGRIEKVAGLLQSAKDRAVEKARDELDVKRVLCAKLVRAKMAEEQKSAQDFFNDLAGGGLLSKEGLLSLFKDLGDSSLGDQEAEALFEYIAGKDSVEMSEDSFLELIKLHFKCVKGTVMAEDIEIKSKAVRRLEPGDIVEALEGPSKESTAGILRIKCKVLQGGAVGWATLAGNQGTPFLETCANPTTVAS